jgi:hypothetical protein
MGRELDQKQEWAGSEIKDLARFPCVEYGRILPRLPRFNRSFAGGAKQLGCGRFSDVQVF